MPLDPIFAERLRTHRVYLIKRAISTVTARVGALLRRPWTARPSGASVPSSAGASATDPTASSSASSASTVASAASHAGQTAHPAVSTRQSAAASARAAHRKAALAWDRRELTAVGVTGPDISTREVTVPVEEYPDVRVRIYDPRDPEDTTATMPSPLPAFITFFGGSFSQGGIDYPTNDAAARRRAHDAGVVVVAVDYALAPEHRYPTAVMQGYAVLEWVHASASSLGIRSDRVAVGGTSAGGGLAAAVTLLNRSRGRLPVALQLLEVPALDLTARHIDFAPTVRMGIPFPIVVAQLMSVARDYLGDRSQARDALASPLRARDFSNLPPAVILTAEYDPLRRHGPAYAHALRRAGGDATCVQYAGVIHDVPIFGGVLPAARRWHAEVVEALRSLHDG
ncbi:MAG: alpha/beta hydrolase [Mycetocola sp.]